ncbi:type I methionyl aminopeptidase, partial [Streptomyces sp. NPDC001274]
MVQLKTDTSIDAMRETGRVVARLLTAVREAAVVGVSLRELDEVARGVLREAGAGSPFLNYR